LGLADPWRDDDRLETEVVPGNRDLIGFVSRDVHDDCCYPKKVHYLLGEAKLSWAPLAVVSRASCSIRIGLGLSYADPLLQLSSGPRLEGLVRLRGPPSQL